MEILKITKNLEVVCESKKTRNGFKHEATLLKNGKEISKKSVSYINRTWENYQFESVLKKLFKNDIRLTEWETRCFKSMIKNGKKQGKNELKTISTIAGLGEIFGKTKKEKNDWKARMMKAGLENKGLIMPDNWDKLDENEKERRLNGVLEVL